MTEKVGRMWEEGEVLASRGDIHEALVRFMRAKAILLDEFKTCDSTSKDKRILKQILTKLNESITKNVDKLDQNPKLALLCRGPRLTKKDVKKCYRTMILKYHPDKNQDCDTSCIFTTIQSAYEHLVEVVPSSPQHSPRKKSAQGSENAAFHSHFYHRPKAGFSGHQPSCQPPRHSSRTQSHAPVPPVKPKTSSRPSPRREEDYYTSHLGGAGNSNVDSKQGFNSSHGGDVYGMSSEQIRQILRVIQVGNGGSSRRRQQVDKELCRCSREDLVRRYLNERARGLSTGVNETQWLQKLESLLRQERKRVREQERNKAQAQEQERNSDPPLHTFSPRHSDSRAEKEANKADIHRKERVARMKKELPLMNVSELKRMMITCGIPLTGCLEKEDLLKSLCKYYGISHESLATEAEFKEKKSHNENNSKMPEIKKVNMNMTSDSLRRVMKSSGYSGFGGNISPRSSVKSSTSGERDNVGALPAKNIWTRERIREMEKKLNRDRSKRTDRAKRKEGEGNAGQKRGENKVKVELKVNHDAGQMNEEAFYDIERVGATSERVQQNRSGGGVDDDIENIVSPRGRFLDAEDSDIDDRSNSTDSDIINTSSEDDEILWRKFIHHPVNKVRGQQANLKSSSFEEDMHVEIPSMEELMKGLGDFDFELGGIEETTNFPTRSYARSDYEDKTSEKVLSSEDCDVQSHATSSKLFDDPSVSPQDMKAARLRGIKMKNESSINYDKTRQSQILLGTSMLADGGDLDIEGDEHDDNNEKEKVAPNEGISDSYWRDLIMHGRDGYNDTLHDKDVASMMGYDNELHRSEKAGRGSPTVDDNSSNSGGQHLHSCFFLHKSSPSNKADTSFSDDTKFYSYSPSATAWR